MGRSALKPGVYTAKVDTKAERGLEDIYARMQEKVEALAEFTHLIISTGSGPQVIVVPRDYNPRDLAEFLRKPIGAA